MTDNYLIELTEYEYYIEHSSHTSWRAMLKLYLGDSPADLAFTKVLKNHKGKVLFTYKQDKLELVDKKAVKIRKQRQLDSYALTVYFEGDPSRTLDSIDTKWPSGEDIDIKDLIDDPLIGLGPDDDMAKGKDHVVMIHEGDDDYYTKIKVPVWDEDIPMEALINEIDSSTGHKMSFYYDGSDVSTPEELEEELSKCESLPDSKKADKKEYIKKVRELYDTLGKVKIDYKEEDSFSKDLASLLYHLERYIEYDK